MQAVQNVKEQTQNARCAWPPREVDAVGYLQSPSFTAPSPAEPS